MDGHVDAAVQERTLKLGRKDALRADGLIRLVGYRVAGSSDGNDLGGELDFVRASGAAQRLDRDLRLRQGELAAPRPYAKSDCSGSLSEGAPDGASCLEGAPDGASCFEGAPDGASCNPKISWKASR